MYIVYYIILYIYTYIYHLSGSVHFVYVIVRLRNKPTCYITCLDSFSYLESSDVVKC